LELKFKELFGMSYTSPSKVTGGEKFVEEGSPDHVFLGRRFVRDAKGRLVAPLRKSAIWNLMIWTVDVKGFTKQQVFDMRVEMALREAAVHSNKFFKKTKAFLVRNCPANGIKLPCIGKYEERREQALANYHRSDYVKFEEAWRTPSRMYRA